MDDKIANQLIELYIINVVLTYAKNAMTIQLMDALIALRDIF